MASSRNVTLFHVPNTRSTGALILLEELGAAYELRVLDRKNNEQRAAPYLSINPMGKVPALLHDGALVTEQAAIYIYLADLFPEAGLAPAIGDSLRGPYLRWMVFYGSCFEPALIDRSQQRAPASVAASPYGDYETMLATIEDWLDARVRHSARTLQGACARQLAPYALVWEKLSEAARETEIFNLDKRPLVLSLFADLAAAVQASPP